MSEPPRRKVLVSKLAGRTAPITGVSHGIGAVIARAFAAEGASIAILHLGDEANAGDLVAEIAPTAVLLASGDGAFYVGQTLSPNGGDVML
jgi:NAD(P)-dependent dehydrogenase (short-subunit alcohol dehydrogenase family)